MIGKLILGLGSIAGGSLAAWRLAQEVVEVRKLGPPAWWAMWRYPVGRAVESPPTAVSTGLVATRVFRWDRDRWVSLTPFVYDRPDDPDATKRVCVSSVQPTGRSLYAQVWWSRKLVGGAWTPTKVRYAESAANKLPR